MLNAIFADKEKEAEGCSVRENNIISSSEERSN